MALDRAVDVTAADPASRRMTVADVRRFADEATATGADGSEEVFVGVSKSGNLTALHASPAAPAGQGRHRRR